MQWPPAWRSDGRLAGKEAHGSCWTVAENLDTSGSLVSAPATILYSETPSRLLAGATRLARSLCKGHQQNDSSFSFVQRISSLQRRMHCVHSSGFKLAPTRDPGSSALRSTVLPNFPQGRLQVAVDPRLELCSQTSLAIEQTIRHAAKVFLSSSVFQKDLDSTCLRDLLVGQQTTRTCPVVAIPSESVLVVQRAREHPHGFRQAATGGAHKAAASHLAENPSGSLRRARTQAWYLAQHAAQQLAQHALVSSIRNQHLSDCAQALTELRSCRFPIHLARVIYRPLPAQYQCKEQPLVRKANGAG